VGPVVFHPNPNHIEPPVRPRPVSDIVFLADRMLDDASNKDSATPIHVYVTDPVPSEATVGLCHKDIKKVWLVTVAEPQFKPLVLITILDTL